MELAKIEKTNIIIKVSKSELQRTEEWREERRGRWTGSQFKSLMSCAQGKSKLKWDNLDRIFSFGATSIKYIYENAMERKTGRYLDSGEGTYQMRFGTLVEPLISKAAAKKLKHLGKMKQVGFKKFPMMPNSGVSSDAVLLGKKKNTVIASVEMKACTTWQTHYDRTFDLIKESGTDFWQVQGEMLAWGVSDCFYVVSEPPSDIKKYLHYDGDIMEMYKEFLYDCPISIQRVEVSKLHQDALIKRITIAEQAIGDWLSEGGDLVKVLNNVIEFYHNNPNKLEKYITPLPFQKELKKRVPTMKNPPLPPAVRTIKKKKKLKKER